MFPLLCEVKIDKISDAIRKFASFKLSYFLLGLTRSTFYSPPRIGGVRGGSGNTEIKTKRVLR